MFPRKRIKKPPDFKYPHNFSVGDLIIPKETVNLGSIDNGSLAVVLELFEKNKVELVSIVFQNTGRVATYNIGTLVMLFNKLV